MKWKDELIMLSIQLKFAKIHTMSRVGSGS
ncbi:MAG: hypothetical protein RJA00_1624 [Bacteroidota bacterium]|jgi:hypothetical protein